MATLSQLRHSLEEAWTGVVEGWRNLTTRAAGAITRFTPARGKKGGAVAGDPLPGIGWGVLAAEVREDDDRLLVRLEAPGMKRGDFRIEVVDDVLVVRGEKKMEKESSRGRCHVVECAYGLFERAIPLPAPVDLDRARARYRRGVLTVELPLARRRPEPLKITIR